MISWPQFAAAQPRLAMSISGLLHQYGPGLGYLATVRPDGGPRIHPVSPVITEQGLYCFILDSPKRRDLDRDGRYALHSFPPEDRDDEAYLAGRATQVIEPSRVAELVSLVHADPACDWCLYEFHIDVAMFGTRMGAPRFWIWHAPKVGDRRVVDAVQ